MSAIGRPLLEVKQLRMHFPITSRAASSAR